MGTYYVPRNVKGETRILYIFTVKGLVTTAIGAGIGSLFYFIFSIMDMKIPGAIIMAIFALIGFAIGTIKIPNLAGLSFTKKVGGESLDEIILRYAKFKKNKKLYVYTKEEK